MAYEKAVGPVQLAGVTAVGTAFKNRLTQPTAATGYSHMRFAIKGYTSSTGGDSTGRNVANPFRGTLYWDSMNFYLTGASQTAGTSFVIQVETDAIKGHTGLVIAGISTSTGGTSGFLRIPNLHKTPGSPIPTHLNVIRTVGTSGTITFELWAQGKATRGNLSTSGGAGRGGDRVLQGNMFDSAINLSADALTADATFTLTAGGASANFQGLDKMSLWEHTNFWLVGGATTTGSWQAAIVGTINGVTYVIAETTAKKLNGTSDAASYPNPVVPLEHYYSGVCPRPTSVIITEVDTGGISNCRVVMVAKSHKGTYR